MSHACCVTIPLSAVFVIVIFLDRTDLLFLGVIHANSYGFGESAHLLGLV